MKRIKYFLLAAVIAALDQIIKFFIRKLPEGQAFFSASPFFELRHVTNTGAAFSLLASRQSVIVRHLCTADSVAVSVSGARKITLRRGMYCCFRTDRRWNWQSSRSIFLRRRNRLHQAAVYSFSNFQFCRHVRQRIRRSAYSAASF